QPGGPGGARGGPPMRIALAPLTPNGSLYNTNADGTTGQFDFPKVIAGSYVAYLYQNGMTIRSNIEVRNGDVDGVMLPIAAGIDTPINLTFDGTPPPNLPPMAIGGGPRGGGNGLMPTLWRNPTILNAPS